MSLPKKSNLLTIKEIFPADIAKQIAALSAEPQKEVRLFYEKLPRRFEGFENWPKSTNLFCWWCGIQNTGTPLFLPIEPYSKANGQICCTVFGHFDCWSCVVSFLRSQYNEAAQWDLYKTTLFFASAEQGREIEEILPSPPKTIMEQYCGSAGLSPAEYRQKIATGLRWAKA